MAGLLYHSPARVIKEFFIVEGYGSDPEAELVEDRTPWPVYRGREPDTPDEVIKVSDTQGRDDGFCQVDSEQQVHHGIQIMVRSADYERGYRKALALALALDAINRSPVDTLIVDEDEITTGTGTGQVMPVYQIASVRRTTDVIPLGPDTPQGKRLLFTVNAIVALRLCS